MWAPILSYTLQIFAELLGKPQEETALTMHVLSKIMPTLWISLITIVATLAWLRGSSHWASLWHSYWEHHGLNRLLFFDAILVGNIILPGEAIFVSHQDNPTPRTAAKS